MTALGRFAPVTARSADDRFLRTADSRSVVFARLKFPERSQASWRRQRRRPAEGDGEPIASRLTGCSGQRKAWQKNGPSRMRHGSGREAKRIAFA